MTVPMSVAEREHVAQQYAADLAPALRSAIDKRNGDRIAELICGLNRQQLFALIVVLASEWPTTEKAAKPRKYVTCWGCNERKRHEGHGLCRGCHIRWDDAGRPASGPPPAMPLEESLKRALAARAEKAAERTEDYADLASWRVDDEEAAERLGVSIRTVGRYRKRLQDAPLQLSIHGEQRRAS